MSRKPPHVIAIYPGSFDPITNGHLDLIEGGWRMFDRLFVSFLRNDAKMPVIVTAPPSKNSADLQKSCPNASNYLTLPFTTEQLRKTVSEYVPSIAG